MWILNFLPNIVFHIILAIGILGLLCSVFLKFIPALFPYKLPIQVISIIALIIGIWYEGGIAKDNEYKAKTEEYEQKILIAQALSESYNAQLQYAISQNEKKIANLSAANRKKLKELSEKLNRECKVDTPVINLLNNAARGIQNENM